MRVMEGERGNIGIFILTHLLVALLVGFFLWSIFPEPWREFLRNGPWGIVVVVLIGSNIVVSIVRGERERSEEHTSELQSQSNLVCRLLLEKKKTRRILSGSLCRASCHSGASQW